MTGHHDFDPLLGALARLPSALPSATRDARIRRRCHDVLDRQRAARARLRAPRPLMARVADVMIAATLCAYAVMALVEAFRLTALL
jgi:hypothetical protein